SYYVTYRFVPSGTSSPEYERRQTVSRACYTSLEPGQMVTVRFCGGDPSVSSIEERSTERYLATAFAVVWYLGLGKAFSVLVARLRRERWLARSGVWLAGRIVECTGFRDSEDDYTIRVRYGFSAPG